MLTPRVIELPPPGRRGRPPDAVAHASRAPRFVAYRRRHPAPARFPESEQIGAASADGARDSQRLRL